MLMTFIPADEQKR